MKSNQEHWDALFTRHEDETLGWYEEDPRQTMALLDEVVAWGESTVFLPGVGTTVLVETLVARGAKHLVLNDISRRALDKVRSRLAEVSGNVTWLQQDIADPLPSLVPEIDIWIDRAVLHFLIDEDRIVRYFANLLSVLKPGGLALFAEFSRTGAEKCAGLPLHRYDVEELSGRLGDSFTLVAQQEYTYINPNGDPRPYVYALYRRKG